MKLSIIIAVSIFAAACGLILARSFFGFGSLRPEFPEFFRDGKMQRTPKLEQVPEIQAGLHALKAAGLCGLIYNVRVSRTMNDARMIYDCSNHEWKSIGGLLAGNTIPPYEPFKVTHFAILERKGELIVVTEGADGQQTFEELAAGISKVINEVLRIYPEFREAKENQKKLEADRQAEQQKKQDEVKKSFSK